MINLGKLLYGYFIVVYKVNLFVKILNKVFILKKLYLNHALKGKLYGNIQTTSGIVSSRIISETAFTYLTNRKILI